MLLIVTLHHQIILLIFFFKQHYLFLVIIVKDFAMQNIFLNVINRYFDLKILANDAAV